MFDSLGFYSITLFFGNILLKINIFGAKNVASASLGALYITFLLMNFDINTLKLIQQLRLLQF